MNLGSRNASIVADTESGLWVSVFCLTLCAWILKSLILPSLLIVYVKPSFKRLESDSGGKTCLGMDHGCASGERGVVTREADSEQGSQPISLLKHGKNVVSERGDAYPGTSMLACSHSLLCETKDGKEHPDVLTHQALW